MTTLHSRQSTHNQRARNGVERGSVPRCLRGDLFLFALIAFLTGCSTGAQQVNHFLGSRTASILANPSAAQAVRVTSPRNPSGTTLPAIMRVIDGCWVLDAGPRMPKAYAVRVASLFRDPATYRFDAAKGCRFDPSLIFRVWGTGTKDYVDLIICFRCDEFEYRTYKAPSKLLFTGHENCEGARTQLVKLALEAFPDNSELRALAQ